MSVQLGLAYVAAVFIVSGTPGPHMLLSMMKLQRFTIFRRFNEAAAERRG